MNVDPRIPMMAGKLSKSNQASLLRGLRQMSQDQEKGLNSCINRNQFASIEFYEGRIDAIVTIMAAIEKVYTGQSE